MAKPLPVGTLRFLCLGLHSEFGIAVKDKRKLTKVPVCMKNLSPVFVSE